MKKYVIIMILVLGCIQQDSESTFSDLTEDLACLFPLDMVEEFVINSQEEYEMLLKYVSGSPTCENFVLPSIDFSQSTLLGKYTYGSGCSVTFERHVYIDDANRQIIYSITVIEEGNCEMLGMSMNWIIIPKVPQGYSVVFEVQSQHSS